MRAWVLCLFLFLLPSFILSQNEKNIKGESYFYKGNLAYQQGKFQEAEELYRKGLLLPSDHKYQANFNLANAL